ncbi:hypothetical protein FQN50_001371 [Emmonsiellopsis sp. PD_5]|nr:hypothetical protein FQN50_001371 [Emmonsiellopsis sp. PD_5]
MGNAQSTYPQRRRERSTNRLSKPPTNYSSNVPRAARESDAFGEPTPLSPYGPYSPWLDSQYTHSQPLQPPVDELLSGEPSSPLSLRPSHGSGSQNAPEDGRTRSNLGGLMGEFKRRLSRSGSQTKDNRFSRTPDLEKVDASLSQKVKSPRSGIEREEPERTFGLGISTQDESPPAETHRFSSIRRLSLYTSAKTTKTPKNLLQTIFSPRNTEQEGPSFSYWGPNAHMPIRRTSADTFFLYEMTRSSPLRASTPSDLEYSHLGRLKLGSLRVVNGSASPAPSDRVPMSVRRQSFSDMKSIHLEQRNSSDLLRSRSREWGDTYLHNNLQRGHTQSPSSLNPSPSRLRTPRIDRSKSPLRTEHGKNLETPSGDNDSGLPVFRLSWPKNPEAFLGISPIPGGSGPSVSESPISFEPTPVLLTTSKTNEFDDDLFDDEGVEMAITGKRRPSEPKNNDDLSRGRLMESSRRESTSTAKGRKACPLTKADSGYSSASSKRSLRHHKMSLVKRAGVNGEEDAAGLAQTISSGASKAIEECNETGTSRPTSQRTTSSEKPPPVPLKDFPPVSKSSSSPRKSRRFPLLQDRPLPQLPKLETNSTFAQRKAHMRSLSHEINRDHILKTGQLPNTYSQIKSPASAEPRLRSFLSDSSPEQQQKSWLGCSPGPSLYGSPKPFEMEHASVADNQPHGNILAPPRTTSVQTKKSTDLAHPHPLQAHAIHRPQSMVNLNKRAMADSEPGQPREERQRSVRGSFFRYGSRSKKRSLDANDRTRFFGHRRAGSKTNTNLPPQNIAPAILASPVHSKTHTEPDNLPPPVSASSGSDSASRPGSRANRKCNRMPSIFNGPFPSPAPQNSRKVIRPQRSFVRSTDGRRDPFFCVG